MKQIALVMVMLAWPAGTAIAQDEAEDRAQDLKREFEKQRQDAERRFQEHLKKMEQEFHEKMQGLRKERGEKQERPERREEQRRVERREAPPVPDQGGRVERMVRELSEQVRRLQAELRELKGQMNRRPGAGRPDGDREGMEPRRLFERAFKMIPHGEDGGGFLRKFERSIPGGKDRKWDFDFKEFAPDRMRELFRKGGEWVPKDLERHMKELRRKLEERGQDRGPGTRKKRVVYQGPGSMEAIILESDDEEENDDDGDRRDY